MTINFDDFDPPNVDGFARYIRDEALGGLRKTLIMYKLHKLYKDDGPCTYYYSSMCLFMGEASAFISILCNVDHPSYEHISNRFYLVKDIIERG